MAEEFDLIELPDELLEGIAGGAISDDNQKLLRKTVLKYKESGVQLDVVLRMTNIIASKHQVAGDDYTNAELTQFVRDVWAKG